MTKALQSYTPHLVVKGTSIAPGSEWTPPLCGWTLIQVAAGAGYWLQPRMHQELEVGMVLLMSTRTQGSFRASQLGALSLQSFPVELERMMGFLTCDEQRFFEMAVSKDDFLLKVFPAKCPISERMQSLCAVVHQRGPSFRLQLLQLFFEAFGNELKQELTKPGVELDTRERLRNFLKETPPSELLDISMAELSQMTRCTPRHLSRVFQEVVGMSFREKQTELRLSRARELLATTKSKVVDVALESGYQSLSLFNFMFNRRFGMSPGRWRQTFGSGKPNSIPRRRRNLVTQMR